MLFSAVAASEGLPQEACQHTLPIFDGHQRYDLKLAFKRMDKVTAEKGYAGPVVVCSAGYEPIAGHRASTPLVKYLSEGREMEIALAPVADTRLLAPFRMSVVSMVANLVIEANRFEATSQPLGASTVDSSPNGDRWHLCKDASGRVFVLHQANIPSGGQTSRIELGDFLTRGYGPEQQALVQMIGTLIESTPGELLTGEGNPGLAVSGGSGV